MRGSLRLLFAGLPNTTNQLACHSVLAHAGRVHSFRQMVVGFEDCGVGLNEVFSRFVGLSGSGEGAEDVFDIVAFEAVEQEVGGIEFGQQSGSLFGLPRVDGRVKPGGLGERLHVFGRAGQLECPLRNPTLQRLPLVSQLPGKFQYVLRWL